MKIADFFPELAEGIEPSAQGWYLQHQKSDKSYEIIQGPMPEPQVDTLVDQRGGSAAGWSKTFVSQDSIEKAQDVKAAGMVQQ